MDLLAYFYHPRIDPVAFELGPLAVRWYGLSYLLGFVLCYIGLRGMIRRGMLRMTADGLGDLMTWIILGVILGGRLGWLIFYYRPGAEPVPWYEPLAIWRGGMSFHGGLLGVAVVLIVWTRRKQTPFWNLADSAALVTPIALMLGRIANFINAELFGRPTTVPWGMIFPDPRQPIYPNPVYEPFARHPSQLYEAFLEGPVLLGLLWLIWYLFRPKEGRIAALFVVFYGIIRFSVEFTRQPDEQLGYIAFGWLTMGQLLSFVMALLGLFLWHRAGKRNLPTALPRESA